MFRHFLFLSISTAVAVDVIKHHLIHHLDESVDPCDNFFRHVCPSTLPESEYLIPKSERVSKEIIENGYTEAWKPENLQVLKVIQELDDNFVGWNVENIIDEFYKKCLIGQVTSDWLELFGFYTPVLHHDSDCARAKQVFAGALNPEPLTFDITDENIGLIIRALNAIFLSRHGIFKTSLSNIRTIVKDAKNVLQEWVQDSPWVVNHNVTDIYFHAAEDLDMINVYDSAFVSIYNVLAIFEQTYVDCLLRTGTTSWEGKLTCYLKAKELKEPLFLRARQTSLGLLSPPGYIDNAFEFNAYNGHPILGFNYPVQLFATSDIPAIVYGAAGFVISHEVSHSLIKGEFSDPLNGYFFSNETTNCIGNQLRKTCDVFDERNIHEDGYCNFPPTNEKIASFDDDGADLLGGKVAYELAKRQYGNEFYERNKSFYKLTNQQLFFYSLSTAMCFIPITNYDYEGFRPSDHSALYMRINAVLAQNPEFREAFQCEDDSRMVQSATEQCEIFGQFAPLNKISR